MITRRSKKKISHCCIKQLISQTSPKFSPTCALVVLLSGFCDNDFKMWYEALPSAVIVFVLLNIPDRINSLSNKLVYKNEFKRDVGITWMQKYYARDWELTGDPYKAQGLESLPDQPSITGIDWKKYGKGSPHSFYGTTL